MLNLLPVALAGLALGAFFYGGLWWTVRKGLGAQYPALWFLVSFLLRTGLILVGLYWVADGQWQRLLVCLCGCITARFAAIRLCRIETQGYRRADHAD
ncbi:MAG: ATP synthase subunit I [Desulfocapsaceae bacterium]|nr:ATP synthase subunit I [Desulfocapsaceae bacterium]